MESSVPKSNGESTNGVRIRAALGYLGILFLACAAAAAEDQGSRTVIKPSEGFSLPPNWEQVSQDRRKLL